VRGDVLDEAVDDAERILERVPARDLQDVGIAGPQPRVLDRRRLPLDLSGGSVLALERGRRLRVGVDEPGGGEDRGDDLAGELLVLGGEGVDRRGDDVHALAVEVLPDELLAREQACVRLLHPLAQERPRLARDVVGRVEPDVAAPDHPRAGLLEPRHEARRLRIVQDDDVALADRLAELLGVRLERVEVGGALVVAERAAVALGAVQAVVDALGDLEEGPVA
jgi:hypothetical protein